MVSVKISVIITGFLMASQSQCKAQTLLLAQPVWRHGDRSPMKTYVTDPNPASVWPQGFGYLSAIGMQQQYSLGQLLAHRYIQNLTFISANYTASEVYIRSTDLDRTLMSAYSNLAGFYQHGSVGVDYPSSNQVANWPTNWSPVPVHTVPFSTDNIGHGNDAICPKRDYIYHTVIMNSTQWANVSAQFQALIDMLSNKSGGYTDRPGAPFTLHNIDGLYDTFKVERIYNLTMPPWLNDSTYQSLRTVKDYGDDLYFGLNTNHSLYVPKTIKLIGGFLLQDIINNMQMKISSLTNITTDTLKTWQKRKYYAYSAHDSTVAALMSTLRDKSSVVGAGMPKYTACTIVELWNVSGNYAIKVLYHSDFNQPIQVITRMISGCPTNNDFCPFSTFLNRSQQFLPGSVANACALPTKPSTTTTNMPPTSTKKGTNLVIRGEIVLLFICFLCCLLTN